MKAGIIGVPVDGQIGTIESTDEVEEKFGMEFHTTLDVVRVEDLSGDTQFIEGTGLKEDQIEEDQAVLEDGTIRIRERRRKDQQWADFIAVEARNGHNGFVVVSTSAAEFIFDLVARLSSPGTLIDRADIQLGDFLEAKPDYNLQGAGGNALSGYADKFMTWGSKLEEDSDLGDLIEANKESDTTPIAPGSYTFDGWGVHCNVAQSGWVEVWDPDWDTTKFVEWLEADVLPYATAGDDE